MKLSHKKFLIKNIEKINKAFGINLSMDTIEDQDKCEMCIDICDSEYEFNSTYDLCDNNEYTAKIDGKYLYFNEINYT